MKDKEALPDVASKRRFRSRSARSRILKSTAVLPSLCTICNGLAGFGAIHMATKDALGSAQRGNLTVAAWLIFAAMAFDVLDGRLARMTRRTSDFGAQLDSLCDVISFGVAPAVLVLRLAATVVRGQIEGLALLPNPTAVERVIWCIAAIYVACAVLRLARFNVENEPDESAHMNFRGLPSPGAAAAVTSLVLLFNHLTPIEEGWRSGNWLLVAVSVTMPIVTLATALLMVSRFRYPHVLNQYIRGRRPFGYLVKLVVITLAMMLDPFIFGAVAVIGYALSGPVGAAWRKVHTRQTASPPEKS